MYGTSNEHTRAPFTAHSYNVSFSEEIGHFEYCKEADPNAAQCSQPGAKDKGGLDDDDALCFTPSEFGFPPCRLCRLEGALPRTWISTGSLIGVHGLARLQRMKRTK
jgi:hypothetical protein